MPKDPQRILTAFSPGCLLETSNFISAIADIHQAVEGQGRRLADLFDSNGPNPLTASGRFEHGLQRRLHTCNNVAIIGPQRGQSRLGQKSNQAGTEPQSFLTRLFSAHVFQSQ
jgi:hypothetical protein